MEAIEIGEKVEEIKKDAFLCVSNWWGHRNSGIAGYIVTKSGELYSYKLYHHITENMKDSCVNHFKKVKKVSEQFMEDINTYFKKNIEGKDFPFIRMFDVSFTVEIEDITINNYTEIYKEIVEIIKEEIERD